MDDELQKLIHAFKRAGNKTGFIKLFTTEELSQLEQEIESQKTELYLQELKSLNVEMLEITQAQNERLVSTQSYSKYLDKLKPNYHWETDVGGGWLESDNLKLTLEWVKREGPWLDHTLPPNTIHIMLIAPDVEQPRLQFVLCTGYPMSEAEIARRDNRKQRIRENAAKKAEKQQESKLKKLEREAKKLGLTLAKTENHASI